LTFFGETEDVFCGYKGNNVPVGPGTLFINPDYATDNVEHHVCGLAFTVYAFVLFEADN
jgi:hypothetical protein